MNDHDLYTELRDLAVRIKPDQAFVDHLEQQLEERPMNTARPRFSPPLTRWLAAAALALLIAGAFLTVPPLRTWAQDLIERLFYPAESDQQRITYAEVDVNAIPTVESLDAADALADTLGFDVLIPSLIPDDMIFEEGRYFTETPYLSLSFANRDVRLMIYQMDAQLDEIGEWERVGASAEIQDLTLTLADGSSIPAQYVQGAWVWMRDLSEPTPYPGQGVDEIMTWNGNTPMRRLRWMVGERVYEIDAMLINGGTTRDPLLSLEEMIAVAERLQ
ncbi:MAG: hypothetical protein U0670_02500 [Anaerolineae bacterium]